MLSVQTNPDGPVVATLAWRQDGQSANCISAEQENRFFRSRHRDHHQPGDYYVNVHYADHPGGAVRGQLTSR